MHTPAKVPTAASTAAWLLLAAFTVVACVTAGGCTSAGVKSQQVFEQGAPRQDVLVVEWALAEEGLRAEAERTLCDELTAIADCECRTATEHGADLDEEQVDGIVTVVPNKSYFPDPYVPLSRSHAGYSVEDPMPGWIVKLWSYPEIEVVWQATARGGFQSERLAILDMSRKIAHELLEVGLVAPAGGGGRD